MMFILIVCDSARSKLILCDPRCFLNELTALSLSTQQEAKKSCLAITESFLSVSECRLCKFAA